MPGTFANFIARLFRDSGSTRVVVPYTPPEQKKTMTTLEERLLAAKATRGKLYMNTGFLTPSEENQLKRVKNNALPFDKRLSLSSLESEPST